MRSSRCWRPYGAPLLALLLSAVLVAAQAAEDRIVTDLNHPLAGETLNFRVRILDIQ